MDERVVHPRALGRDQRDPGSARSARAHQRPAAVGRVERRLRLQHEERVPYPSGEVDHGARRVVVTRDGAYAGHGAPAGHGRERSPGAFGELAPQVDEITVAERGGTADRGHVVRHGVTVRRGATSRLCSGYERAGPGPPSGPGPVVRASGQSEGQAELPLKTFQRSALSLAESPM
ncbi:hypothetical protein VV01_00785 [Luteipulveratus halotolerans]|uniref:Uncharacterized protein n=1 Tax=Luteipulveratus halotolerans TaxID=1631356 RepID=A0A0L6CEC5_9MICO|nr:hypothetical protein VV01_00785 [Luteipulveratus halotolerans]